MISSDATNVNSSTTVSSPLERLSVEKLHQRTISTRLHRRLHGTLVDHSHCSVLVLSVHAVCLLLLAFSWCMVVYIGTRQQRLFVYLHRFNDFAHFKHLLPV